MTCRNDKCGLRATVTYVRLRINQAICSMGNYFPWSCSRVIGLTVLGCCISQAAFETTTGNVIPSVPSVDPGTTPDPGPGVSYVVTLDTSHVLGLSGLGWPTAYVPTQGSGGLGGSGSAPIGLGDVG